MARHRAQPLLDDEQHEPERREARLRALEELNALRRSIQLRIGIHPGDPVTETRAERERQRDTVFTPIRRE
jgi:class 3 adenylate cyclase